METFEDVRSVLESVRKQTKPRMIELYEVCCGVLHLLKSECPWQMLRSEFPKWQMVYAYFSKWSELGPDSKSALERV
ncbi:transposase [Nitrosomonas communis]|uniref:transposase n=1 Tax=Nitrosomonas communis TaxID=44574 RepID=UPI003528E3D5